MATEHELAALNENLRALTFEVAFIGHCLRRIADKVCGGTEEELAP